MPPLFFAKKGIDMPPLDFSPMLNAFVPDDLITTVLLVALGIGAVYVVCFSIVVVLVTLRGGSVQDQLRFLRQLLENSQFEERYRREAKRRRYYQWKKGRK
jgi:hypothetical protein